MKKITQILVSLGVLTLIAGAFGMLACYIYLNHYLASDGFRSMVSQKTSEFLKVKGEFMPLNWSGFSVQSDGFEGKGIVGGNIQKIKIEQIRATLNFRAVFLRTWQIDVIELGKVAIDLGAGKEEVSTENIAKPSPDASPESPVGRIMKTWLPNKVVIKKIISNDSEIIFPAKNQEVGKISGVRIAAEPVNETWKMEGNGGIFSYPGLPKFSMGTTQLRCSPTSIYVTQAELRHDAGGQIILSGEMSFSGETPFDFTSEFKRYPVSPFLPEDWKARLQGGIVGKIHFTGQVKDSESYRAKGELSLADGKVVGLPWFDNYEAFLPTQDLRSMNLKKASLDFVWNPSKLVIKKIWLESESLLCIQGEITKENNQLDGRLDLGTTSNVVRKIPGAEKQIFVTSKDGYIWTPVKIGGTWPDFTEDLTPRLKAAVVQSAVDNVQGIINKAKGASEGTVDFLRGLLNR